MHCNGQPELKGLHVQCSTLCLNRLLCSHTNTIFTVICSVIFRVVTEQHTDNVRGFSRMSQRLLLRESPQNKSNFKCCVMFICLCGMAGMYWVTGRRLRLLNQVVLVAQGEGSLFLHLVTIWAHITKD